MPCLSYTVHLTLYTLHPTPRMKNIFFIFVRDEIPYYRFISFYLPKGFISFYVPLLRLRTLFIYTQSINAVRHLNSRQAIHAKPTRRQASKQPSGYTLRLRYTRNIKYAHTHNSKSNFFIRKCSQNLRISKKCSIFAPNLQVAWK